MKKSTLTGVIAFLICSVFLSCNSGTEPKEQTTTATEQPSTPVNEMAEYRFTYTIANVPPPMGVLNEFSKAGLPVKLELLNDAYNADNYHSSNKKALNYGIYGVDLAYVIFNERNPEILKYYPTVKKLAGELDMAETFNHFVNRFQDNSENKDSLARIIDEVYNATDHYLRSNERLMTASVILAGTWIEAQHITVNSLLNLERNATNDILFQRVWEQRFYLENIAKLLDEFKDDEELMKIKNVYNNLLLIYKEPSDSQGITQEFLTKLSTNIEQVRSKMIS